jgi:hypothetical protein
MAIKQVHHIEVDEESDLTIRFFHTHPTTGLPIDLTGYRADMQVRTNYDGTGNPQTVLTYTSEVSDGLVLGGAAGTIDLFIVAEDTMKKNWSRASYDIFLVSPSGKRDKFIKGFFTIIQSNTLVEGNEGNAHNSSPVYGEFIGPPVL